MVASDCLAPAKKQVKFGTPAPARPTAQRWPCSVHFAFRASCLAVRRRRPELAGQSRGGGRFEKIQRLRCCMVQTRGLWPLDARTFMHCVRGKWPAQYSRGLHAGRRHASRPAGRPAGQAGDGGLPGPGLLLPRGI